MVVSCQPVKGVIVCEVSTVILFSKTTVTLSDLL